MEQTKKLAPGKFQDLLEDVEEAEARVQKTTQERDLAFAERNEAKSKLCDYVTELESKAAELQAQFVGQNDAVPETFSLPAEALAVLTCEQNQYELAFCVCRYLRNYPQPADRLPARGYRITEAVELLRKLSSRISLDLAFLLVEQVGTESSWPEFKKHD